MNNSSSGESRNTNTAIEGDFSEVQFNNAQFIENAPDVVQVIESFSKDDTVAMNMPPGILSIGERGNEKEISVEKIGTKILNIMDDGRLDGKEIREIKERALDPFELSKEIDRLSEKIRGQK